MIRLDRLAILLAPALIGLASLALPGRAQQATSARYAFSDTTLLRDTLGLHFDRLFPLADSLQTTPDTLRALAVRYRLRLDRLVHLADSLAVSIDSVGAVLERERFNPLAAGRQHTNDFRYTSGYNIAQTNSSWSNGSDYNFVNGGLFIRNGTTIQMDRYQAGGNLSLHQTRSSNTEVGWKFSPGLSTGGQAKLTRYDNKDPVTANEGERTYEYQLALRTRQTPLKGLNSELNFFSGVLDLTNSRQVKRGGSGDLNGRVRLTRGWLTHDVSGQLTGNLAHTRTPGSLLILNTHDLSSRVSGTLGLLSSGPVGFNLNYQLRRSRVETPLNDSLIQQVVTANRGVDGTLRLRKDSDRYLNLTQRTSTSEVSTGDRTDQGFNADGRYAIRGWTLDARFQNNFADGNSLRRLNTGGYKQVTHARSLEGTLTRQLGERITAKATGNVSLTSDRSYATADSASPPVPHDQYRQSYRLECLYTRSENLNSGIALEVTRTLSINIPSASASANSELHSYLAEWRWSYRLMTGLTATQRNQLTADYRFLNFNAPSNSLSLDYSTVTTLSAVVTPRFSIDLTHNARFQPNGSYTRDADTGLQSFKRADESKNYELSARVTYAPTPAISLNLSPDYLAIDRNTTVSDKLVPQRRGRTLNFSGGANLNLPIGRKGQLTGGIARTFRDDRSTTFTSGSALISPRALTDYWNGSLQLSWQL